MLKTCKKKIGTEESVLSFRDSVLVGHLRKFVRSDRIVPNGPCLILTERPARVSHGESAEEEEEEGNEEQEEGRGYECEPHTHSATIHSYYSEDGGSPGDSEAS